MPLGTRPVVEAGVFRGEVEAESAGAVSFAVGIVPRMTGAPSVCGSGRGVTEVTQLTTLFAGRNGASDGCDRNAPRAVLERPTGGV